MSFFNDLLFNFKDGIVKKGFVLLLSLVAAIGMYMFAYFDGKKTAEYKFLATSQKQSQKFREAMEDYTKLLDKQYREKLDAINKAYSNGVHNSLTN
tara:strand:+ start:12663 stop:12950 length:288 start_codon:yes stop_codon:yes gene_type:complete